VTVTGFFTKNIGWKLLSLCAAVLLWISVASEPELATLQSVPVQYKGVPDELEISSSYVQSVTLELRGPSGRLRDLRDARSAVVLDFSAVHQPGEQTFSISPGNVSIPRGIQLVRAIPAQLRFTFERRIVRQVPVEVRLSAPHEGYAVVHQEAIPSIVTITGPETAVGRTASVVTDRVDISGVVASAQFRANTYLAEPQARFVSPSQITVRVTVKKK
jgi:YbbR domain-containing protein